MPRSLARAVDAFANIPIYWPITVNDIDIPDVLTIEKESFPIPWSDVTYLREISKNELSHFWAIRTVEDGHGTPPLLAYGGYWVAGL